MQRRPSGLGMAFPDHSFNVMLEQHPTVERADVDAWRKKITDFDVEIMRCDQLRNPISHRLRTVTRAGDRILFKQAGCELEREFRRTLGDHPVLYGICAG